MSFERYSLYGSQDSEEVDVDNMDYSGFIGDSGSVQPRPKVTQRPRSTSNASGVSSVGYTLPNPAHEEPTDAPVYYALSPFWAHDESLGNPKYVAIAKLAGVTGMLFSGIYSLGKRRSGDSSSIANTIFVGSTALYTHPVLGVNHGLLSVIPGQEHWLAKYPRYGAIGAIHLGTMYGFKKIAFG